MALGVIGGFMVKSLNLAQPAIHQPHKLGYLIPSLQNISSLRANDSSSAQAVRDNETTSSTNVTETFQDTQALSLERK